MASKAAKPGRDSSGRRVDRTKSGATPRRAPRGPGGEKRESWLNAGCGMLLATLLFVIAAAFGGSLALSSTGDLADQLGLHGRPLLHMRIDGCHEVGRYRNRHTNCYGYGSPGTSGVTPEMWMIAHADQNYTPGTVLPVHCTPTGGCEATGVGPAAGDVAGLAVGLLLLGGLIGVLVASLRSRLGRGAPSRGWIRAAVWSGSSLAAVATVSGIVYLTA